MSEETIDKWFKKNTKSVEEFHDIKDCVEAFSDDGLKSGDVEYMKRVIQYRKDRLRKLGLA